MLVNQMQERWTDIQGLRIHYLYRDGDGPDVLVLPGGVLDTPRLAWKKVLENLSEGYRVFAVNLPGYGGSDLPPCPPTTEWFAEITKVLMERLGITAPVLLAASRSGGIALELALSTPLRALVLAAPHGLQARVPLHEAAYALSRMNLAPLVRPLIRQPEIMALALRVAIRDPRQIDRELIEDALHEARRPRAFDTFFGWVREELQPHVVRSNYRADVSRLDLPVLILQGKYDLVVNVRAVQEAAARIPSAELHVFETGHMAPRERPREVVEIVNSFLARKGGM